MSEAETKYDRQRLRDIQSMCTSVITHILVNDRGNAEEPEKHDHANKKEKEARAV